MDLKNKDLILNCIKEYCNKTNLDYFSTLEVINDDLCNDNKTDIIIELLKINNDIEDVCTIVVCELNDIVTKEVLENSNEEDVKEVMSFLKANYYDIFNDYYVKKGCINRNDYNDCIISLCLNYNMEDYVADVLLGEFIHNKIIKGV